MEDLHSSMTDASIPWPTGNAIGVLKSIVEQECIYCERRCCEGNQHRLHNHATNAARIDAETAISTQGKDYLIVWSAVAGASPAVAGQLSSVISLKRTSRRSRQKAIWQSADLKPLIRSKDGTDVLQKWCHAIIQQSGSSSTLWNLSKAVTSSWSNSSLHGHLGPPPKNNFNDWAQRFSQVVRSYSQLDLLDFNLRGMARDYNFLIIKLTQYKYMRQNVLNIMLLCALSP